MSSNDQLKAIEKRNKKTVMAVFGIVFGMVVLAYASVPLYNLFCKVTGFGGTTERVAAKSDVPVLDREMEIRFRTATAQDMPWAFNAEADKMTVKVGADGFINFKAHNPTGKAIKGTAIYNVTPIKAARYFKKIQCFCFGEQILTPGQTVNMPVMFFVDPAIADDVNLMDVKTITLSYTFYRQDSEELETQLNKTYKNENRG